MDKEGPRKKLKAERLKLSSKEVKELSRNITVRCLEILNKLSFSSLHIYLPKEKLHEVDTWPLIKLIQKERAEVKIAYAPFAGPVKFESLWLKDDKKVPEDFQFNLIIVPQLGF